MSKNIVIHSSLGITPTELLTKGYQIPSGTVATFGGTVAPTGWFICDGSSLVRADFQNLFNAVGSAHGAADATHFNLPDLRGRFVRGVDGTAGNDPDRASRTAANLNGNVGNNVGSVQADEFKSHNHTANAGNAGGGLLAASFPFNIVFAQNNVIGFTGGNETRPKNVYLNYIIKY